MSSNSFPVLKFLFRGEFKSLQDALKIRPGYEMKEFSDAKQLASHLATLQAGLVIASLRDKSDLANIISFTRLAKNIAKDTGIKVIVINYASNVSFERSVLKLGIVDLITPNINPNALKFKLDFLMRSLSTSVKLKKAKLSSQLVKGGAGLGSDPNNRPDGHTPFWAKPLEMPNDIWLIRSEFDCKKILSRWLVKLMGPGPKISEWTELKPGVWRFDVQDSKRDSFIIGEGSWYFVGEVKPEFNKQENLWFFCGEKFDLFFKDSQHFHHRIQCKDKFLTICKNSPSARLKEPIIAESFVEDIFVEVDPGTGGHTNDHSFDEFNSDTHSGIGLTSAARIPRESGDSNSGGFNQRIKTDKISSYWDNKKSRGSAKGGPNSPGPEDEVDSEDHLFDTPPDGFSEMEFSDESTSAAPIEDFQDPERDKNGPLQEISESKIGDNKNISDTKSRKSSNPSTSHITNKEKKTAPTDSIQDNEGPKKNLQTPSSTDPFEKRTQDTLSGGKSDKQRKDNGPSQGGPGSGLSNIVSLDKLREEKEKLEAEASEEASLEDLTTDSRVICSINSKKQKISCELHDFFEDSITFLAREKNVDLFSDVRVELSFMFFEMVKEFEFVGKVAGIEEDGEGKYFISIQMNKEDTESFEVYMGLYEKRQSHVSEFLKKAKGL
jgi:hypothetical protein